MSEKPRVRVKAGSQPVSPGVTAMPSARTVGRYLRGDRGGILINRRAVTRDMKVDVREAAARASALAWDFMQNSGWIAGAADQVIVDTLGVGLSLNARPALLRLGWSEEEITAWIRIVQPEWRQYAFNPVECDLEGKATVAEQLDGAARYHLAGGEAFGVISYLTAAERRRYGIRTGTKLSLAAPHRLKRETNRLIGLEDGIFHDGNGRPRGYRFQREVNGFDQDADVAATDRLGLRRVIHVMDRGDTPNAIRGISPIAPIAKVIAQYDQLADATLATALIQTIFAATIKSPEPSKDAFEAISAIGEDDDYAGAADLRDDLFEVWGQRVDGLKNGAAFSTSDHGRINHLGPGEEFEIHTAGTPGAQYLPFAEMLQREIARRIGVTFTSLSMNHKGATYSSVRMETATVWPLALRRRERVPAPIAQGLYECWLDEAIFAGRIPFKDGYAAFAANREAVFQAEWQGPAKPSADDFKSAQAAEKRMQSGVSTLAKECADNGEDWQEVTLQRARERKFCLANGLPDPFVRMSGGAGPQGGAADGEREPPKVEE